MPKKRYLSRAHLSDEKAVHGQMRMDENEQDAQAHSAAPDAQAFRALTLPGRAPRPGTEVPPATEHQTPSYAQVLAARAGDEPALAEPGPSDRIGASAEGAPSGAFASVAPFEEESASPPPSDEESGGPLRPWYEEARDRRTGVEAADWVRPPSFLEAAGDAPAPVTERPAFWTSVADESTAPLPIPVIFEDEDSAPQPVAPLELEREPLEGGWPGTDEAAGPEGIEEARPEPAESTQPDVPAYAGGAGHGAEPTATVLSGDVPRPHEFGPLPDEPRDTPPAPRYVLRQLEEKLASAEEWWPGEAPVEPAPEEGPSEPAGVERVVDDWWAGAPASADDEEEAWRWPDPAQADTATQPPLPLDLGEPVASAGDAHDDTLYDLTFDDRTETRSERSRRGSGRRQAKPTGRDRKRVAASARRDRQSEPVSGEGSLPVRERPDSSRRPSRSGRGAVIGILALALLGGAAVAVAAVVPSSTWEGLLRADSAVPAQDEGGYVLPAWPEFGASPRTAETAPPLPSLTPVGTRTVDATRNSPGVDPVIAAALPYPDPPAVEPKVIRRLEPKHRYIAITVDDGVPFDTRLLDLFERYGTRCTTFVNGQFASTRPDLLERLKSHGFEIANHGWSHKDLTKLTAAGVRSELSKTQDAISSVTDNQAPYMRPPGGGYNDSVKRISAEMGYNVVLWNRSLADTSSSATPEQLYKNAMDDLQPGDIILCHWGRPQTYAAMAMILPELEKRGYRAVTLSELIADSGGLDAAR